MLPLHPHPNLCGQSLRRISLSAIPLIESIAIVSLTLVTPITDRFAKARAEGLKRIYQLIAAKSNRALMGPIDNIGQVILY